MSEFWQASVTAIDSPVGDGLYTLLVLMMLSAVSLLLQRKSGNGGVSAGVNGGLLSLMALRLIQVAFVALGLFQSETMLKLLPALERGVHLASAMLLVWLWLSAREGRVGGALKWGLGLALLATALMMLFWRVTPAEMAFNFTDLDFGWGLLVSVVLVGALLTTYRRRGVQWETGVGLFAVLLVGQVLHLLVADPNGNYPLFVQAANLLALPLLYRLPVSVEDSAPTVEEDHQAEAPPAFVDESETSPLDPEPANGEAWEGCEALGRVLAQATQADACILGSMDSDTETLIIHCAFVDETEQTLLPAEIALAHVPRLATGLRREGSVRLAGSERHQDIGVLRAALGMGTANYLLAATLPDVPEQEDLIAILLRAEEAWQLEDQQFLEGTSPEEDTVDTLEWDEDAFEETNTQEEEPQGGIIQPFLEGTHAPAPGLPEEPDRRVHTLLAENEQYRQDVERLLEHIDHMQHTPGEANGAEGTLAHQADLIEELQRENRDLRQAASSLQARQGPVSIPSSLQAEQAKEELRLALEQVAILQSRLDAAQQALVDGAESQSGAADKIPADKAEVIASIAQELRQPLSSILGYTDLLLSESVGILGALQRNFLERVHHSTTRMNNLIDNLIHIAELDSAGFKLEPKPVDLATVIDDAIALIRPHLQEKQIILRVDLPSHLPELNTDRDALQQILFHLLQNADAATPAEGEITLRAFTQQQADLGEFAMLQVSDSGGGIPEDELPRVFSRVYRAKNPIIRGVGDTGVGLTIAETLTEALGGRIWVESEEGVGATFSVLMPLEQR